MPRTKLVDVNMYIDLPDGLAESAVRTRTAYLNAWSECGQYPRALIPGFTRYQFKLQVPVVAEEELNATVAQEVKHG